MVVGGRRGKCVNIGNCSRADKREEVITSPGTDFVCPECGKSLIALTTEAHTGSRGKKPLVAIVVVGIVAILGLFWVIRGGDIGDTGENGEPPEPPTPTGVLENVKQTGILRVGMEPDAPPLHYLNERKQNDGFDFRLAGMLAESIGASRVQIVEADYEDLPSKLLSGEVDIMMGGYVPDPSIADVDWSIGYLDFGLSMIVHERNAGIFKSPADVAGKRIAIYDDPAAERWVNENIPGAQIEKFSGDSGWFEAVEEGRADALIYDYPFAAEEIKSYPKTMIVRYNLNRSKYAVGVARGNYELVYAINEAIENFRATPQYPELLREYLTASSPVFMQPIPGKKTYTVEPGDSLSKIAMARLGSADRWPEIWELNRDRVANEDLIYPKLVLLMP